MILPHERTRREAREDRYRLLEATRANFSPIFLMFEDDGAFSGAAGELLRGSPTCQYEDDSRVLHRLHKVPSSGPFEGILGRSRAFIADGHHRYATALRYRDAHGPDGAWTLGYFTPIGEEGLLVLPYHRVVRRELAEADGAMRPYFDLEDVSSFEDLPGRVARSTAAYAFGLCSARRAFLAESRPAFEDLLRGGSAPSVRALDTFALHDGVFKQLLEIAEEDVEYHHSLAEVERVLAASPSLAVLMRPTSVRHIVAVSVAGESMPPKSTFFFPKLPSGLVVHRLLA
jgi:uncharacterized protein (DUF1015 family)